jgi:hypothetical protein
VDHPRDCQGARGLALTAASLLTLAAIAPSPAAVVASEELQLVELPEIGVTVSFPADWHVMTPMTPRASWFDVSADDATPVYRWAAVFALGDAGRWCDIDRYEDFPWTFEEHAAFLEHWRVSASLYGRSGGYARIVLPSGPAFRVDVNDELKGRNSTLYLFEHGRDHVQLTCSDTLGSEDDWLDIAESIELGPRTVAASEAIATALDAVHAE